MRNFLISFLMLATLSPAFAEGLNEPTPDLISAANIYGQAYRNSLPLESELTSLREKLASSTASMTSINQAFQSQLSFAESASERSISEAETQFNASKEQSSETAEQALNSYWQNIDWAPTIQSPPNDLDELSAIRTSLNSDLQNAETEIQDSLIFIQYLESNIDRDTARSADISARILSATEQAKALQNEIDAIPSAEVIKLPLEESVSGIEFSVADGILILQQKQIVIMVSMLAGMPIDARFNELLAAFGFDLLNSESRDGVYVASAAYSGSVSFTDIPTGPVYLLWDKSENRTFFNWRKSGNLPWPSQLALLKVENGPNANIVNNSENIFEFSEIATLTPSEVSEETPYGRCLATSSAVVSRPLPIEEDRLKELCRGLNPDSATYSIEFQGERGGVYIALSQSAAIAFSKLQQSFLSDLRLLTLGELPDSLRPVLKQKREENLTRLSYTLERANELMATVLNRLDESNLQLDIARNVNAAAEAKKQEIVDTISRLDAVADGATTIVNSTFESEIEPSKQRLNQALARAASALNIAKVEINANFESQLRDSNLRVEALQTQVSNIEALWNAQVEQTQTAREFYLSTLEVEYIRNHFEVRISLEDVASIMLKVNVRLSNSGSYFLTKPEEILWFYRGRNMQQFAPDFAPSSSKAISTLIFYKNQYQERVYGFRPAQQVDVFETSPQFLSYPSGDAARAFETLGGFSADPSDWELRFTAHLSRAEDIVLGSNDYSGNKTWEHVPAPLDDIFVEELRAAEAGIINSEAGEPANINEQIDAADIAPVVEDVLQIIPAEEPPLSIEQLRTMEDNLPRKDKMAIQRRLSELGYYRGIIDGIFGPATARSISSYQESLGVEVTGVLALDQLNNFIE